MLVASLEPAQVGVVPWPGAAGTWTVVVKRTFELVERGIGGPSCETVPLCLDRTSGGILVHPTDFAPAKQECDVLIVGAQLSDPLGPVRLVVGELRKLAENAAAMGPRPGVGGSGDPMDPALAGGWAEASFDPEAFQSAPRDQRLPRPRLPLDFVVDVADLRFATRVEGPSPEALLLDPSGWQPPISIALRIDTVAIDPAQRRVSLVFRGVASAGSLSQPILVLGESLRTSSTAEMLAWPRSEAIEPSLLRRLAQMLGDVDMDARRTILLEDEEVDFTLNLAAPPRRPATTLLLDEDLLARLPIDDLVDELTVSLDGIGELTVDGPIGFGREALPFVAPAPAASPLVGSKSAPPSGVLVEETADGEAGRAAPALPFEAGPRLTVALPETLRRPRDTLVDDDSVTHDHDPLERTVAAGPSPSSAPMPFFRLVPPAEPERASAPPAAVVAEERIAGLSAAQFSAVKAEIWSSVDGRRAVLGRHGLTELAWRLAERRFVRALERTGATSPTLVRLLQEEVAKRRGAGGP